MPNSGGSLSRKHSGKVLVIAGEASGDLHGANLVSELKKLDPGLSFFGVGSRNMRDVGVDLLADASEIAVVGITEVLTHIRTIYQVYVRLKRFILDERPDLLVLIDFPDFNIRIGSFAKSQGVRVLYYISPQVWAWRRGRVHTIARIADVMVPVFPFEVPLYEPAGIEVRFEGHPLVDIVRSPFSQEQARREIGLDSGRTTIALLPGSRHKEIRSLLPDMIGAARIVLEKVPDAQFVLPIAPTIERRWLESFLVQKDVNVHLIEGRTYDVLRAADSAIVASGTATLETALLSVPMVILYRVSRLTALIVRLLANYDHVGLVNIVAGKRVVPELLQDAVTPENIAREMIDILADKGKASRIKRDLQHVSQLLGEKGASGRVAAVAHRLLEHNR